MLFVGVAMVGGGIIVEIWQGGMADDVVDAIRADQQQQIALATERAVDAEDRAANASIEANASNERAVRLLRIESDRQVIVYSDAFDKLRAFKNISVWVNVAGATIKTLSDRNLDQSLRPQIFQQLEEKGRFASTFDALKAVGWNVTVLSPNDPRAIYMPAGPDADAVTVYSRGPEDVWQCDDTPYAVATNTPEMNECAAAGALAKYLSAIGAGPARHSSVDRYVSLPKGMPSDAILVMIGAHNTPAALEDEERSLRIRRTGKTARRTENTAMSKYAQKILHFYCFKYRIRTENQSALPSAEAAIRAPSQGRKDQRRPTTSRTSGLKTGLSVTQYTMRLRHTHLRERPATTVQSPKGYVFATSLRAVREPPVQGTGNMPARNRVLTESARGFPRASRRWRRRRHPAILRANRSHRSPRC